MEQYTTSIVIDQEGEKKNRGAFAIMIAVAFVAMLGIGSTFAYMTYTGNQTPNRFTVDKGLTVDLVEPAWQKGIEANDKAGYPNVASDGATIIPAAANNFSTEGTVVAKDPYVVNTSMVGNEQELKGANAYVAIRLTFQKWVASTSTGIGEDHKETGKYVTMDQTEVEQLMKCYAFGDGTQTEGGFDVAATEKLGWKMLNGNSYGNKVAPQMVFVYQQGIESVGAKIVGTYPEAQTELPTATSGTTTTTNLFTQVKLVDAGDNLSTLIKYLKQSPNHGTDTSTDNANNTEDPGWRILVDTAAIECTSKDLTVAPSGYAEFVSTNTGLWPEVRTDGKSPATNNGRYYSSEDGGKTTGSGYGKEATNVPESYWGWTE